MTKPSINESLFKVRLSAIDSKILEHIADANRAPSTEARPANTVVRTLGIGDFIPARSASS